MPVCHHELVSGELEHTVLKDGILGTVCCCRIHSCILFTGQMIHLGRKACLAVDLFCELSPVGITLAGCMEDAIVFGGL